MDMDMERRNGNVRLWRPCSVAVLARAWLMCRALGRFLQWPWGTMRRGQGVDVPGAGAKFGRGLCLFARATGIDEAPGA
jgi:hypothetical protein